MLGTNDVRSTGCTSDDMVKGCSQLVLLLRAGAKILFKTSPRFFLLAPPNIANSKAERCRKSMLIPAMKRAAYDTGARFVHPVALVRKEMWHDGIHFRPAAAKRIAKVVAGAIRARNIARPKAVATSIVSLKNRQRALTAARQMGKTEFLAMSRTEMRSWAYKYHIPFRGARKEHEMHEILSKVGANWKVF